AERHELHVHMVSNSWMRLIESRLVHRVVVSEGPDIADDWIVENAGSFDIVITSDIPLAARCIEKNSYVIGPKGKQFTPDSIGTAMAVRDLNAHLRDMGEIRGGARPFEKKDKSQFLSEMENLVRKALRAIADTGST
ncbi:MAG: DUF188 domain-containing protein, partial [Fimbriimonadaceae bacterium]|nr:DUF188 domain-containing protein [Alphaproteobacteria bacterium]